MAALPEVRIDGQGPAADVGLRVALALAAATGRDFELADYGADRERPGLGAEALAWVRAAGELAGATVEGALEGSSRLVFRPSRRPEAGERAFDLAGAGPTTLLLEALLPALILAPGGSRLTVRGATHGPDAPTFHDLALGLAPTLRRLGVPLGVTLDRAAFEPDPEGRLTAAVSPGCPSSLTLRRRGMLRSVTVFSAVADLPAALGVRLARAARKAIEAQGVPAEESGISLPHVRSRGATVTVVAVYERAEATFSATAREAAEADGLGVAAAARFLAHHASGAALPEDLAARLLPVLALTAAGLCGEGEAPVHHLSVSALGPAFARVADVVARFLPVDVARFARDGEAGEVRVAPRGVGEVLELPVGREPS